MLVNHGGGCCGMKHIHGFAAYTLEQKRQLIDFIDEVTEEDDDKQGCLEVVLTDYQMMTGAGYPPGRERGGDNALSFTYYGWAPHMAELGFKLVARFQNSNHGNWCNVLHLHYNQVAGYGGLPLPYEWDEAAPRAGGRAGNVRPAAPPAPVVPHIVFTLWHNVYRGDRRGAGYPSIIAAREQRAVGRVDRLDVYSDATTRWTENV